MRDIVVTLVHGTWGRKAKWTSRTSPLTTALRHGLPTLREIYSFEWNGRNSNRARLEAAQHLRWHHERVTEVHEGAAHFIIAHSHGGNVAFYACRDADFSKTIGGVACLATPFIEIHAPKRNFAHVALTSLGWVLGLQLLGTIATMLLVGWILTLTLPIALKVAIAVISIISMLIVLPVWGFIWLFPPLAAAIGLDRSLRRELGVLPDPLPSSLNLLIVRSPADEASAALATMHMAAWIADKLYTLWVRAATLPFRRLIPSRLAHGIQDGRWPILTSIVFVLTAWMVVAGSFLLFLVIPVWLDTAGAPTNRFAGQMTVYFLAPFYGLASGAGFGYWIWWWAALTVVVVTVGVALIAVPLAIVGTGLYLCQMPFGFYSLNPRVFWIRITAEVCPPGRWVVNHLRSTQRADDYLAHAGPYSQPESHDLLVEWLRSSSSVGPADPPSHSAA